MSSSLQMARKECCNFQADGTCIALEATVPADAWLGISEWWNWQRIDCSCLLGRKSASIVPEPREFHSFKELDRFLAEREGKVGYKGLPKLCRYFEKAVLPLVKYRPKWEDSVLEYNMRRIRHELEPIGELLTHPCLDCGRAVAGKAKYCPECLEKRRREKRRKRRGR